jgi:hypothetical protein
VTTGMLTYRFLGFSRDRRLMAGQFIRCEDVNQARQRAHEMVGRRMVERVEVWHDQRQVYKVSRRSLRSTVGYMASSP